MNICDFLIEISTNGDEYCCIVNPLTSSNRYTTRIPGTDTNGSFFGMCTCGVPQVDGLPCQHMIALCKSGRIEGLDEPNVMPYWWHTSHWRKHYPQGVSVGCNFSIDTLRAGEQDKKYKLCPAISGPKKTGRPKFDKRHTRLMEQEMEKKKKPNTKWTTEHKVTKVSKEDKNKANAMKRKAGTATHASQKNELVQLILREQIATYGTKRVSQRKRK